MSLSSRHPRKRIAKLACILVAVIAAFTIAMFGFVGSISSVVDNQARLSIKQQVTDAAIQCFAIEGSYPASLQYLEDNYNLRINHNDYIVTYECFASNVLPETEVLPREG